MAYICNICKQNREQACIFNQDQLTNTKFILKTNSSVMFFNVASMDCTYTA